MKRQKWLTGILAVMLVASFLLAVGALAPIAASASGGGGGGIEPEEICSNFQCMAYPDLYCAWNGDPGYFEYCRYEPYPYMCQYCDPCGWWQCHWW